MFGTLEQSDTNWIFKGCEGAPGELASGAGAGKSRQGCGCSTKGSVRIRTRGITGYPSATMHSLGKLLLCHLLKNSQLGTGNTKILRHCPFPRGTQSLIEEDSDRDGWRSVTDWNNGLAPQKGPYWPTGWRLSAPLTLGKGGNSSITLQKRNEEREEFGVWWYFVSHTPHLGAARVSRAATWAARIAKRSWGRQARLELLLFGESEVLFLERLHQDQSLLYGHTARLQMNLQVQLCCQCVVWRAEGRGDSEKETNVLDLEPGVT